MPKALLLDIETTGLTDPRPVEVAYAELVTLRPPTFGDIFYQRYNPGKPIEYGAMATHHITDEEVITCEPASEFRLPPDTTYLIGHNVDFDYQAACACGPQPAPKRICTLALSRFLWPEMDSHSLGAMIYRLDRQYAPHLEQLGHTAPADIHLCRVVLEHILRVLPPILTTWEALWQRSEQARVPTRMPFGKYRGTAIRDVPGNYRQWMLRQADIDPYLVKALRAAG